MTHDNATTKQQVQVQILNLNVALKKYFSQLDVLITREDEFAIMDLNNIQKECEATLARLRVLATMLDNFELSYIEYKLRS